MERRDDERTRTALTILNETARVLDMPSYPDAATALEALRRLLLRQSAQRERVRVLSADLQTHRVAATRIEGQLRDLYSEDSALPLPTASAPAQALGSTVDSGAVSAPGAKRARTSE